ncbi:MAG: RNA polymerase sigma factor [Adhaeribacter sp.]
MHAEDEIIAGCKQEKPHFQEKLYQLYSRRMMAICVRYTNNRFEAEDIFHEAFVKVFKYINTHEGGSFEGWMKRIFVNTAINHYHKNRKYAAQLDYSAVEESVPAADDVLSNISSQELLLLINKLPEGYRVVFNLYVIEGYNHREIGEMLNIAEGTSKSQLAKAKGLLKKMLQQYSISDHVIR